MEIKSKGMSNIFAIDPGTLESGWCVFDGQAISSSGISLNDEILRTLSTKWSGRVAIEMIASYGMPVGQEVFETCVWIGRFIQACFTRDGLHASDDVQLVYRRDVKVHLCNSPKAKDSNIRQALLDMFPRTGGGKTPQIGTKARPGPLYGVSSHTWAALGVAVTAIGFRGVEQ